MRFFFTATDDEFRAMILKSIRQEEQPPSSMQSHRNLERKDCIPGGVGAAFRNNNCLGLIVEGVVGIQVAASPSCSDVRYGNEGNQDCRQEMNASLAKLGLLFYELFTRGRNHIPFQN